MLRWIAFLTVTVILTEADVFLRDAMQLVLRPVYLTLIEPVGLHGLRGMHKNLPMLKVSRLKLSC